MKKGLTLLEERVGAGTKADKKSRGTVLVSITLNKGDYVQRDLTIHFDLQKRDLIAGLRYTIEGMCVGGFRKVKVSPHLGYGKIAVEGAIPPNSVLIIYVELTALE